MSSVLYIYLTAIFYYSSTSIIMTCLMFTVGIILTTASFYVFPLIVTFDMTLKDIFRNSIIWGMANLPQNMLVLVSLTIIHTFLLLKFPILWLILMVFFLIAFSSYTINFAAWNAISKHMHV